MYQCACRCSSVKFEIYTNLKHAINCHCQTCRKTHGSAFVSILVVLPEYFKLLSGEKNLKRYPQDESKTGRFVCDACGSKLFSETEKGKPLSVYTTVLDSKSEAEVEIMAHVNIESKCPVYLIYDDLPQFESNITKEDFMQLISQRHNPQT